MSKILTSKTFIDRGNEKIYTSSLHEVKLVTGKTIYPLKVEEGISSTNWSPEPLTKIDKAVYFNLYIGSPVLFENVYYTLAGTRMDGKVILHDDDNNIFRIVDIDKCSLFLRRFKDLDLDDINFIYHESEAYISKKKKISSFKTDDNDYSFNDKLIIENNKKIITQFSNSLKQPMNVLQSLYHCCIAVDHTFIDVEQQTRKYLSLKQLVDEKVIIFETPIEN